MSNKLYTDICIDYNKGEFFIVEKVQKSQKEGSALATLKRIEEVMRKGLKYSTTQNDAYSKLSSEDLKDELLSKAKMIKARYLEVSQALPCFKRIFGGVASKEGEISDVFNKIRGMVYNHPFNIEVAETKILSGKVYLTGRVKQVTIIGRKSEELEKNLKTAKTIIDHVQSKILFSWNYPQRSRGLRRLARKGEREGYRECYKPILELTQAIPLKSSGLVNERRKAIAENGVGACGEMTEFGFDYAQELGVVAGKYYIKNGDHGFLIIGATNKIDLDNLDPNAVICDPWTGAFYPLACFGTYLKDFKSLNNTVSGFHETEIRSFDPKKQQIKRFY